MNLPLFFNRSPEFQEFKRRVDHPGALEFIFNLCSNCQNSKGYLLELPIQYVAYSLGLPEGVDPNVALRALIDTKMVALEEGSKDVFRIHVFETNNRQLKACWANGALGGRPKIQSTRSVVPKVEEPDVAF